MLSCQLSQCVFIRGIARLGLADWLESKLLEQYRRELFRRIDIKFPARQSGDPLRDAIELSFELLTQHMQSVHIQQKSIPLDFHQNRHERHFNLGKEFLTALLNQTLG